MKKIMIMALVAFFAAFNAQAQEEFMIDGSKGKLSAVIVKPELKEGEKCPMVMMLHGFMGNKNGALEKGIAEKLKAAGIASIRFDFNGHGKSEGRFQDMTVPNEIEDALKVYEYVTSLPYVSDVAISGHSQGGVVTAMTSAQLGVDKVKCAVLMAPAAVLRDDAIRGSTMGARYNPLDPPEAVTLFGDIKLGREYIVTAFSLPIYETSEKYTGPVCIIHGTGDTTVPYTYGERFHDIWPETSELHIIDRADHGFSRHMPQVVDLASEFLIRNLK